MVKRLMFIILGLAMLVGMGLATTAAIAKNEGRNFLPRLEPNRHQFVLPEQYNGRLDVNRTTNLVITKKALVENPGYTWAYVTLYVHEGSKISIQPGAMIFTVSHNGTLSRVTDLGYLAISDYAVNQCYEGLASPILLASDSDQGTENGKLRLLVRLPEDVNPASSRILQIDLDMSKVRYTR